MVTLVRKNKIIKLVALTVENNDDEISTKKAGDLELATSPGDLTDTSVYLKANVIHRVQYIAHIFV